MVVVVCLFVVLLFVCVCDFGGYRIFVRISIFLSSCCVGLQYSSREDFVVKKKRVRKSISIGVKKN